MKEKRANAVKKAEAGVVRNSDERLLADARSIIDAARANAIRSVDFNRVQMYWRLGQRIVEEEQHGKVRADYGARIIRRLAERLEPEYGSGFGVRQLEQSRQFYRTYPIANALRSQLNWTQYRALIQIEDAQKREYYELESVNHCWTARETERQIHSQLWERLLTASQSGMTTMSRPCKGFNTLYLSMDLLPVATHVSRGKAKAPNNAFLGLSTSATTLSG